jgi:hypothetical protein
MTVCRRSVTIMGNSGTDMNKYSDVVRGDSYYGYTDGLHTIQVIYHNYVGRVRIQCTLSLDPQTEDWFDIVPEITTGKMWNPEGYLQWNGDELLDPETDPPRWRGRADHSEAYTFRGNYTYIRVFMDRRHMGDGISYDPEYGEISRIILSS